MAAINFAMHTYTCASCTPQVMRVYWPDERILENEYVLPLIEPETKDA